MEVEEVKEEYVHHTDERISFQQALDYEVHGHWLTFWIWGSYWGQNLMLRYAAWKVKRKYKRYQWARGFSLW